MENQYQLKLTSNRATIENLKSELEESGGIIGEIEKVEETNKYQFTLEDAASLITIISGAAVIRDLVKAIFKSLNENKQNKIEIKSPIGTIIFIPEEKLSEEEIRDRLKKITEIL